MTFIQITPSQITQNISYQKTSSLSKELKKELAFEKSLLAREIQAELQQTISELKGTTSPKKIITDTSSTTETSELIESTEESKVTTEWFYSSAPTEEKTSSPVQNKTETETKTETVSFKDTIPQANAFNYDSLISNASKTYGVPEGLIRAVIKAESSFNPNAVSASGAQGLMQLMPKTAASLGVKNALDPEENINGGVKYLAQMLNRYDGNVKLALAAYNAGPGNVDKYGGVPPFEETQNYVKKILNQ